MSICLFCLRRDNPESDLSNDETNRMDRGETCSECGYHRL